MMRLSINKCQIMMIHVCQAGLTVVVFEILLYVNYFDFLLLLHVPNYIHLIIGTAQLQNPKRGKTA